MGKIIDRLLGPFNIEMVVGPIDLKISDAVMNFQENGHDISLRIFQACGRPTLGRRRRSADVPQKSLENIQTSSSDDIGFEDTEEQIKMDMERSRRGVGEIRYERYKFDKNEKNLKGQKASIYSRRNETNFEKIIKDVKHIVKDSKGFWSNLPYQICNNENYAEGPSNNHCWNGTAVGQYTHDVVKDGLLSQKENPAVIVNINKPNSILNEQVYFMKAIANKLVNAFHGLDVEWSDEGKKQKIIPYFIIVITLPHKRLFYPHNGCFRISPKVIMPSTQNF